MRCERNGCDYSFFAARSVFSFLTTRTAVLLSSPGDVSFGRAYVDQTTFRLLRSTMKNVPLPRPKELTRKVPVGSGASSLPLSFASLSALSLSFSSFTSLTFGGGGGGGRSKK